MYIVELYNGTFELPTVIHSNKVKLESGKIVKGINAIDSFTFSMFPNNPGFTLVNEYTTLVKVFNTNKNRYDFTGRVLYAETTMDEDGLITKTVTCESLLGYLCDSQQKYVDTRNWTVEELLSHLITCHNSQVESEKEFRIGTITAQDSNDNLYQGIQRENTWDAIKSKLLDKIGGELQMREEVDAIYIDYLEQIGEEKQTPIALSVNMKSITREQDPTAFITRLIPLGCKLTDDEGNETEERLDISSVNDGLTYIDDEDAIAVYGIHVGYAEWDDVTDAYNLMTKGEAWLRENNRVQIKYSITALDLSLIGLAIDDFDVGNTHPIVNALLGIDDKARIIKKNIDVCEEVESTIEVGDNFKTLSDIQREQSAQIRAAAQTAEKAASSASSLINTINKRLSEMENKIGAQEETFSTEIEQLADSIKLEVSGSLGSKANIVLSAGTNKYIGELELSQVRQAFANDPTAISISAGTITFNSNTLIINSSNFTLDSKGSITATGGTIGAINLSKTGIYSNNPDYSESFAGWHRPSKIETSTACFFAGATSSGGADAKFLVTYGGKLTATGVEITGTVATEGGLYRAVLSSGQLKMSYDGNGIGSIASTYYGSDTTVRGLSVQTLSAAKFILFSHISTDGTYYDPDYIINFGLNPSGITARHIFFDEVYCQDTITARAVYADVFYCPDGAVQIGASTQITHITGSTVYLGTNNNPTYLRGSTVYLKDSSATVTSDRNAKNSIEELPDQYEAFFDALSPVRFKYNEGRSGRFHVGYIAQDVESALTAAKLTTSDFAGFVNVEGSGELGLAYDEFIALLHLKIKRLESHVKELEGSA